MQTEQPAHCYPVNGQGSHIDLSWTVQLRTFAIASSKHNSCIKISSLAMPKASGFWTKTRSGFDIVLSARRLSSSAFDDSESVASTKYTMPSNSAKVSRKERRPAHNGSLRKEQ